MRKVFAMVAVLAVLVAAAPAAAFIGGELSLEYAVEEQAVYGDLDVYHQLEAAPVRIGGTYAYLVAGEFSALRDSYSVYVEYDLEEQFTVYVRRSPNDTVVGGVVRF